MAYKITQKIKAFEKSWQLKREKQRKEKEKLEKIYQTEYKKLKKQKEKTDEIERIKRLKEQARIKVYGLTPKERKEKEKARTETWKTFGKIFLPKPPTKAEKKEMKEFGM
jgi:hypothetical protein